MPRPAARARPVFVELDLDAPSGAGDRRLADRAASSLSPGAPPCSRPAAPSWHCARAVPAYCSIRLAGALAQLGYDAPRIVSVSRPAAGPTACRRAARAGAPCSTRLTTSPRADARFDMPGPWRGLSVASATTRIDLHRGPRHPPVLATLDALIARPRRASPGARLSPRWPTGQRDRRPRSYAVDTARRTRNPGGRAAALPVPDLDAAALQGAAPMRLGRAWWPAWGPVAMRACHAGRGARRPVAYPYSGVVMSGRTRFDTRRYRLATVARRTDRGRPHRAAVCSSRSIPVRAAARPAFRALRPGYVRPSCRCPPPTRSCACWCTADGLVSGARDGGRAYLGGPHHSHGAIGMVQILDITGLLLVVIAISLLPRGDGGPPLTRRSWWCWACCATRWACSKCRPTWC